MRVNVCRGSSALGAQARAYAEYRVFVVLARHPEVRGAKVLLRQRRPGGSVACTVTVTLEPAGSTRTRATGPEAPVAIDRAVDRITQLMRRRTAPTLSS